jgi:hypothetical protein
MALGKDIHSYANFEEVRVKHYALQLRVDFSRYAFLVDWALLSVAARASMDMLTSLPLLLLTASPPHFCLTSRQPHCDVPLSSWCCLGP